MDSLNLREIRADNSLGDGLVGKTPGKESNTKDRI